MKHKSFHIANEKRAQQLEAANSSLMGGFKAFLFVMAVTAAFTHRDLPELPSLSVQEHPVREAAYRPASYVTHDTPGQDTGLLNLISDWFH